MTTKTLRYALFIGLMSTQAQAYLSTQECLQNTRDAAVELRELSQRFNARELDRYEFSLEVTRLSTQTNAHRLACRVVEDPNAERCLDQAKKLYDSVRQEINLRSINFGNQTQVKIPLDFLPKLALFDLRC